MSGSHILKHTLLGQIEIEILKSLKRIALEG